MRFVPTETLANSRRGTRVRKATSVNFSVGHYARKVEYNSKEMPTKNHDFLPPELIEILSTSANSIVKQMFTNSFTRGGNLTISAEQNIAGIFSGKRKKWGTALISGDQKSRVSSRHTSSSVYIHENFKAGKKLTVMTGYRISIMSISNKLIHNRKLFSVFVNRGRRKTRYLDHCKMFILHQFNAECTGI